MSVIISGEAAVGGGRERRRWWAAGVLDPRLNLRKGTPTDIGGPSPGMGAGNAELLTTERRRRRRPSYLWASEPEH